MAANWKAIVENYNECHHCGPVHPELCEVVPEFKQQGGKGLDWRVECDSLFHPDEMVRPSFDPGDAVGFWDLVDRQDSRICESVQQGMGSRAFNVGYCAPMEDLSLDIRRYLGERLGVRTHRSSPE